MTFDVFAILMRVDTNGSVPPPRIKFDVSGVGLFAATMEIDSTLFSDDDTVTGTTAPFSAMSGAFIRILSDSLGAPPVRLLIASVTSLALNADSGQAASSDLGISPAPAAMATVDAASVRFRIVRRLIVMS